MKIFAQNLVDTTPELSSLLVSKTGCINMCESGPMVLLYPEGYWFSDMTEGRTKLLIEALKTNTKNPLSGNVAFTLRPQEG
ncbi:MAG: hypothetical protein ACP5OP_02700 [Leptospirillia bacterium]